jgi:hypothetical protein
MEWPGRKHGVLNRRYHKSIKSSHSRRTNKKLEWNGRGKCVRAQSRSPKKYQDHSIVPTVTLNGMAGGKARSTQLPWLKKCEEHSRSANNNLGEWSGWGESTSTLNRRCHKSIKSPQEASTRHLNGMFGGGSTEYLIVVAKKISRALKKHQQDI